MSHYINEYVVLSAIKAVLDADSTLDGLLKAQAGNSKTILGLERPKYSNLPTVHLGIFTRTIAETKQNDMLVRAMWFANALPGSGAEDVELLSNIGERIYDLLDDNLFAVTGYRVMVFTAESGESSVPDMERPEGLGNHFQSLTFRLVIKRIE